MDESSDDESTVFSHPSDDDYDWEIMSDVDYESDYMVRHDIDEDLVGNDAIPTAPTLPVLLHPTYEFADRKAFANLSDRNLATL